MKLMSGVTTLAVTALLLACTACSESTNGPTNTAAQTSTVRSPLISDPPPLDPDVFYQPEGLLIMTSAYQGLLRYVPGPHADRARPAQPASPGRSCPGRSANRE